VVYLRSRVTEFRSFGGSGGSGGSGEVEKRRSGINQSLSEVGDGVEVHKMEDGQSLGGCPLKITQG
jgi:hypothetical protein